jgi:hypothetical protein
MRAAQGKATTLRARKCSKMSSKAAPERALRAYLITRPLKSCAEGPIRGCDGGWAVSLPPDRPQAPKTPPARPFWFGLGSGLDSRARLDSKFG